MPSLGSVGSAVGFFRTVRTISARSVEEEALLGFKLALVGTPEQRQRLKESLLTKAATEEERAEAENYLKELDSPPDADAASAYSYVLYAGGDDGADEGAEESGVIGARGKNGIPITGTIDEIVDQILEQRPDLTVALARRLPRFRIPASNRLIRGTAKVNASLAVLSAIPGILPITAPFLPGSSIADTILLTKNQIMLVMRLAAAHGRKPSYSKQIKEILATVGSALGWRTLAREMAGFVPGGIGVVLKGSIAYSGTMAVGRTALFFYQTGKIPTPAAIRDEYKRSKVEAKQEVEKIRRGAAK